MSEHKHERSHEREGSHEHERSHEHDHIPPPDLPRHKTVIGFRPHILIGGLVLIAILLLYLLLLVRPGIYSPAPAKPAPTSNLNKRQQDTPRPASTAQDQASKTA
jgi:hypothetical protein